MDREPDDLDALLARGRLGGPARERIAQRVMNETAKRRVWPALAFGTSALAAAAALLLLLRTGPDALRPKGGDAAGLAVDVVCTTGELHRCPRGGTLAFSIEPSAEPVYLHAWAEGEERTWYFAGDDAMRIDPMQRMLGKGVVLDAAPGALRVHVVIARRKLTRDQLVSHSPDDVITRTIVAIEVTP
jgi:hypothetical protein